MRMRTPDEWLSSYAVYCQYHPLEDGLDEQRRRKRFSDVCRKRGLPTYLERRMSAARAAGDAPVVTVDKKHGTFNWREANTVLADMQRLRKDASFSQDEASFVIESDEAIAFICLSDTHVLSWGTNHEQFERITDEILGTPNLYVVFLGDIAEMAIKLRSVSEVAGNMLPPDLQMAYVDSWLTEIAPRVLLSTWDNHGIDRQEKQAGSSELANLFSRRFVYHSGIGHPTITVGSQTYKLAVSHRFRGSSMENPCHSGGRYLLREGADREIALAGDSHRPGILILTHSGETKLAVNSGTLHLDSGYAKRYFSLRTAPIFPVVTLDPREHYFTPYWSLGAYLAATGQRGGNQQ